MDNESRPGQEGPGPLTLEMVAYMAQEVALRDGGHAPTIITEGTAGAVAGQFLELPETHDGKVRQMFIRRYILGQSGKIGRLEQVYFITKVCRKSHQQLPLGNRAAGDFGEKWARQDLNL